MGSVRPGRTHSAAPTLNGSFASNCELEESIDMDDPPPPPPLMRDSIKAEMQESLVHRSRERHHEYLHAMNIECVTTSSLC